MKFRLDFLELMKKQKRPEAKSCQNGAIAFFISFKEGHTKIVKKPIPILNLSFQAKTIYNHAKIKGSQKILSNL